jgi:uncharacterized membrane protein
MARENRSDRGAMLALASLLVVFSLAVIGAVPAGAYFYDTDGDQLPDFYEIKHGIHGTVWDEGPDWDGDGLDDAVEDANQNGIVDVGETDPYNPDTDGDGLYDGIEGLVDSDEDEDTLINALDWDSDGDFIGDGDEDVDHDGFVDVGETDWLDADTDDDGLIDGLEPMWGTDPLDPNTDGDEWMDGEEVYLMDLLAPGIPDQITDPTNPDSDGDGRYDGLGNEGLADADGDGIINALDFDSDNDGLIDGDEDADEDGVVDTGPTTSETDPENYDTDSDGFSDGYEIYHAYSDPLIGEDSDGDGWMDGQELVVYKTDPNDTDTDGDGLTDDVENPLGTPYPGRDTDGDGLIDALDLDSDNDGLGDWEEHNVHGTDPYDVDTDGDALRDNAELEIYGTDPTDADDPLDGDPLLAGEELGNHDWETSFDTADTDGDGWDEGTATGTDEVDRNTDGNPTPRPYRDSSINALDRDADGDGLWDGAEVTADPYVTDPLLWDTDGDGLADGEEVHIWGTDPTDDDTDDDGLEDGDEVDTFWTDPLDPDTDGDTVDDGVEANNWGSDPLDPDTDGDGIWDGATITGDYYDADGVLQVWSFTEDDTEAELGGDGLPNVLDTDSDWREWEVPAPPPDLYLDFHDRTEIAYESYVTPLVRAGERFHIGPLNPGEPDTDGDGYPDAQEVACGFDPLDARDYGDCTYPGNDDDGDGLYDIEEAVLGTDINDWDTDNDGLWDGDEIHPAWWNLDGIAQGWPTDPTDSNMDGDNWNDFEEVTPGADGYVTNPHYEDTDGDGVNDYTESWIHGYDPTDPDMDNDELYDYYEDANANGVQNVGETDPWNPDSDGDSVLDGPEVIFGIDPLDTDTDGDLLTDGLECGYATDGDADPATMTDPRLTDSDFDGWDDGVEDANQNGMLDVGETDAQDRDTDDDMLPDYYEGTGNDPTLPPATTWAVGWVDNSADPTLPFEPDTDFDGLEDNLEFEQMTDPDVLVDSDADGLMDGDEYYTYMTDPTDTDTDQDGCNEQTGGGDIEDVTVDTDGDGVHNAMDVDSDNDWVWDGDGTEDCAGVNDADGDGTPDVLDNDTDNDNLSDVQEMGLDTWHQFADNDRDFDEDGILDGDEYYHAIHQPHTGDPNFRASDPKDFDTDNDTLHDGIEAGMLAAIPVDPVYGGTNPDPGVWATDATLTSHVGHWDSDEDGLTDAEEDLGPMFSDATEIGVTETDPQDDDTDDEGLWDGFEVLDLMTDPLLCDTDIDLLNDGLEIGLLGPQGDDTSFPGNPCGTARYDTVEDGAYATDPNAFDTDGDFLLDGEEDADQDGFRDGNSPYDAVSDWNAGAGPGETDPNEWDTDRGGEDDGTEVGAGTDPLLWADGDWDLDIHPDDLDASADTLWLGAAGVGILPGSSDVKQIRVWHTDLVNNPDPDGPSVAANIDSIYMRATSLHWAGPLWGGPDYEVPETDDQDWFHYTHVEFSPPVFSLANGVAQDVDVTVTVPEGAMPGWYFGYVQVETRRAFMEQELPDDYIVLGVYVAPHKDLDICDDDGDYIGVGLTSDPWDFPHVAAQGEMHLMGAPMYPGTTMGMFRYANPNTNPNGVWGPLDEYNDYNGLPAYPWVGRTWDVNTLDPQGNVNLTYHIEAQYEHTSGPVNPVSSISFDSPVRDYLNLSEVDSAYVTIDTTTLPMGFYEGVVRVFEDVHGIGGPGTTPDGVWQGDETYDTFILKFWLTIPDLDIDDDYANMSGNEMEIMVDPGEVDIMIGEILVICPDGSNNEDAWDGPSDESIYDFQYYDPTTDELRWIPTDGVSTPASFDVFSPDGEYSFEVWLDGLMGDSLLIGEEKKLRLRIPEVPEGLPAGTYRTDHPADWVPGDGTVPIAARGLGTGMGALPGESGPGVVYDPDIMAVETLMDFFHLTVEVACIIDIEFAAPTWTVTGDPGNVLCAAATVNNTGNCDAEDIDFDATALIGSSYGEVIPSIFIDFDPTSLSIPLGESDDFMICVNVPDGTRADTYEGTVSLLAGGDVLYDELEVSVVVNTIPDMNILDNGYNVVGNVMELIPDLEEGFRSVSGQFELENLGNADLTDVTALEVTGFADGVDVDVDIDALCGWDDSIVGMVTVTWTDGQVDAGTYEAAVTVEAAEGSISDSFVLRVIVSEVALVEFVDDHVDVQAEMAGETYRATFEVENVGNVDIESGIMFEASDLVGTSGSVIDAMYVSFDPSAQPIADGGNEDFDVVVDVPDGLLGQDYEGTITLYLDGEPMDEMAIILTLERGDNIVIYPNPYRCTDHEGMGITFALGEGVEDAKITIYDMFGNLVTTLNGGEESRNGTEDAVWEDPLENDDGKEVASGMYIVTIDDGDEVETRKIMVIR